MTGLAVILLLAVLVYGQTAAFPFHFDDHALLSDPAVTSPAGWRQSFGLAQTRPLTWLTFWLNYALGGTAPAGYHALNLALHLAATGAAYAVFRRVAAPPAALAATALFALHPLQSEAVCYVFARATILAAVFCLLAWRCWQAERAWAAAGLFCLALSAKEEAVSFPLFLWLVTGTRRRAPLAAMLVASFAAGARLLWVASRTPGAGLSATPSARYLLLQPSAVMKYLQLFVLPAGQNFDHHLPSPSIAAALALAALAAAMALPALAPARKWFFGALVLLAPTSSVIPLADAAFEHRMYLPMISLSLAAAGWLARLPRPAQAALLAALCGATFARAGVWSSEQSLWADAAAKSPNKVRPKIQLARTLFRSDPERAESLILEARRLEPHNPETYAQMGILMLEQRNPYGALQEFDEAFRLAPTADAWANRGAALMLLGRRGEAEDAFRRALALNPCHYNARHNLRVLSANPPPLPPGCRFTPEQLADLQQ